MGMAWEAALQEAIQQGSFFLACFSGESLQRASSYMADELRLAVEILEKRSVNAGWFIPVKLSECEIPEIPIGDGQTLRDIQWVDLFGDWDKGVRKIVDVIRPQWLVQIENSVRKNIIDEGCRRHIKSKLEHFKTCGALRIKDIEDRWREISDSERWKTFLETAVALFDRAVSANTPMTERLVEPGANGRFILITASPTYNSQQLLHSLPARKPATNDSYTDFITEQRHSMRNLPNWQNRDLVHWIFRQESTDGEMEIDLLYLCSYNLMIDAIAAQMYLADVKGAQQMPIEQVYPVTLMTTFEIDRLLESVMSEETELDRT